MAEFPKDRAIKYDMSTVNRDRARQTEPSGTGVAPKPGVYDAVIAVCTPRAENKAGEKKPNIEWQFRIIAGPNSTNTHIEAVGAVLYRYSTWAPDAIWALDNILFAAGIPEDRLNGKGQFTRAEVEGKPVRILVGEDTDLTGKYRGKIAGVYPPGSGGSTAPQAQFRSADDPFGGDAPASDDETPF
jgi:hypothetical protein